jgi:hypothetical protein
MSANSSRFKEQKFSTATGGKLKNKRVSSFHFDKTIQLVKITEPETIVNRLTILTINYAET